MKVGTRSLLFGVHQFIWHPVTVVLAWIRLYGLPTWAELVCIIIHDWGYWGCPNMDGPEGTRHPELGARIARALLGRAAGAEVLCHSRHFSRRAGCEPSRLCWADKLSILYDPECFYLARAWLSGELDGYRLVSNESGFLPYSKPHSAWFRKIRGYFEKTARERIAKPFSTH